MINLTSWVALNFYKLNLYSCLLLCIIPYSTVHCEQAAFIERFFHSLSIEGIILAVTACYHDELPVDIIAHNLCLYYNNGGDRDSDIEKLG
jgi:hypothetical protein